MSRFIPDRQTIRSPLAQRLIFTIIIVSSVITLCLTTLQLYSEYRTELDNVQRVFRQIEQVHLESMTGSLWATNEHDLQLRVEGLGRMRYVVYVAVTEGDKVWAQAGHRAARNEIERRYPMTYAHNGRTHGIGELVVVASLDEVYARLRGQVATILVSNALKTFVVAAFALALFHWLVSRHLLAIAAYLRSINLSGRMSPLKLARPDARRRDDLDEVAAAINFMHADLQSALVALHEGELQLRRLVDGLGPNNFVGLLTLDGAVIEANQSALAAAGLQFEDVRGKPVEQTYWWSYSEQVQQQLRAAVAQAATGVPVRYDVQIRVREGRLIWLDFSIEPMRDESGTVMRLIPSAVVITERKQAETALRDSEERLRLALEAAHMGSFDWDIPRNRVTWSRWHEELWGLKPGEFGGTFEAFTERLYHDDVAGMNAEIARCIAMRAPFEREFRVVWPDGSVHWIFGRGEFTFGADGQPARLCGAVVSISARKEAEQALREQAGRLRAVSRRLLEVQDDERRRLARELHDRVGGNLSALILNLATIRRGLSAESAQASAPRLVDCEALLADTVQQVRDVLVNLRPLALDDLGLFAALSHHAQQVADRARLALSIAGGEALPRLPPAVEIALFRIVQEALNNIIKHARATRIEFAFQCTGERAILTVADDGRGFDAGARRDVKTGLGLITMRERAEAIGARIWIDSAPGTGTRVSIDLPRVAG